MHGSCATLSTSAKANATVVFAMYVLSIILYAILTTVTSSHDVATPHCSICAYSTSTSQLGLTATPTSISLHTTVNVSSCGLIMTPHPTNALHLAITFDDHCAKKSSGRSDMNHVQSCCSLSQYPHSSICHVVGTAELDSDHHWPCRRCNAQAMCIFCHTHDCATGNMVVNTSDHDHSP